MKEFLSFLIVIFLAKSMICDVANQTITEKDQATVLLDQNQTEEVAYDDQNSLEEENTDAVSDSSIEKLIRQNTITCTCGKANNVNKIVGGQQSADHAWPWAVAIVNVQSGSDNPSVVCGGSLISNKYILTAAHCTPPLIEEPSGYGIILGDNQIKDNTSDPSRMVVGIDKVYPHPKYNTSTQDFDAALIRLNVTLTFNTNINPICLGQLGRPFVNRQATVCGWGTTFFGGGTVNDLRDTRIRTIRNAKCAEDFKGINQPITNNMICAYTEGKDTCQGDSGGPMFVNRTVKPEIFKQVGITSTGVGCNEGKPGIYTRVQRIISWIKYRTSDSSFCEDSFTP